MEWRKITCFGDSITRRSKDPDNGCWAGHIAQRVLNYYDVDIRGFEGYNTRWALKLMPQLFPPAYLDQVDIFIVFFGHNDSWEAPSPLHVSIAEYDQNTRAIIEYLTSSGLDETKIILITPGWYHESDFIASRKHTSLPKSKQKENVEKYSTKIKDIALDYSLTCVDFHKLSTVCEPMAISSLFCDGLHLPRTGAELLFNELWPQIEKKIFKQYGKSLDDLCHVTSFEKHPAVAAYLKNHIDL